MIPRNILRVNAYEGNKENYNPKGKSHYSTELRANTKVKQEPLEEHGVSPDPSHKVRWGCPQFKWGQFRGWFSFLLGATGSSGCNEPLPFLS